MFELLTSWVENAIHEVDECEFFLLGSDFVLGRFENDVRQEVVGCPLRPFLQRKNHLGPAMRQLETWMRERYVLLVRLKRRVRLGMYCMQQEVVGR